MEQTEAIGPWQYRVRWPESSEVSLRDWQRVRTVQGEGVFVPLADQAAAMEAEWRTGEAGDWHAAVPHEFGEARAGFVVEMLQDRDFTADAVLRVMALVRGQPACFDLTMPKEMVRAGRVLDVEGVAVNRGPGCLLREAGEFAAVNDAFRVLNSGPGQGALLKAAGAAVPGAVPYRGAFFVRAGRLPAAEIEKLLEYARDRRGTVDHGV
jgi:hypothetical protein